MDPAAEHRQQLRSLRDFLLVYNRMTELCFRRCVCNLNYRLLTAREEACLDGCAARLLRASHRLLRAYTALLPAMAQRRGTDPPASAPPPPAARSAPDPAPAALQETDPQRE